MSEPTLTEVFGEGTIQDADSIIIPKANLTGLEVRTENTAESILAGLVRLWAKSLSQSNQESNPNQQITVINSNSPSFVFRNDNNYKQITYTVSFEKLDSTSELDPNDY